MSHTLPPAPAQHYQETYRETDLEKLVAEYDIPKEHCESLGKFLEDIAAIWRWNKPKENGHNKPSNTAMALQRVSKKAGSLKDAIHSLSPDVLSALNFKFVSAMDHAAMIQDSNTPMPVLPVSMDDGSVEPMILKLGEVTQLIAALEFIASSMKTQSTGWKGPRKDPALRLWIANVAKFWTNTLGRSFTRDVSDTGDPISPAARFCTEAFFHLSPETPPQTVLNAMKTHISSVNRKSLAK